MSEWDRMMKIDISRTSFFWGENKTIPDTSSESICPPTSLNCKGPIDLTDTVIFNPFEFALFSSSPRTLPTLDGGRVQIEVPRQGGGGGDPSIMPIRLFRQRNDEALGSLILAGGCDLARLLCGLPVLPRKSWGRSECRGTWMQGPHANPTHRAEGSSTL